MKYVALLRGINVGGNHKVEMKRLKKLFETHGYSNVLTYINSGNVIFDTPKEDVDKLTAKVEKMIEQEFGFIVPTVIRDQDNIKNIVTKLPHSWTNDAQEKTDILFLWKEYDNEESLKLLSITKGVDEISYISGAIVWHLNRKVYNKSGMHKFIGTLLYKNMTARNINTVRKLNTLMS